MHQNFSRNPDPAYLKQSPDDSEFGGDSDTGGSRLNLEKYFRITSSRELGKVVAQGLSRSFKFACPNITLDIKNQNL